MTRISNIFKRVRFTVADQPAEKFSDSDLFLLLNEALYDFCQRTQLLQVKETLAIDYDHAYFDLPENCYKVTRVLYQDKKLDWITHEELDASEFVQDNDFHSHTYESSSKWETDVGEPTHVIWDRRGATRGKLYPIPDIPEPINYSFDSDFGVLSSDFGVAASNSSDAFGVSTDVTEGIDDSNSLTLYYIKNHTEILTVDDILETPKLYDPALSFYISAQAFLANLDNQYIKQAENQLGFYEQHVKRAISDASKSWTRASQFKTAYRRGV